MVAQRNSAWDRGDWMKFSEQGVGSKPKASGEDDVEFPPGGFSNFADIFPAELMGFFRIVGRIMWVALAPLRIFWRLACWLMPSRLTRMRIADWVTSIILWRDRKIVLVTENTIETMEEGAEVMKQIEATASMEGPSVDEAPTAPVAEPRTEAPSPATAAEKADDLVIEPGKDAISVPLPVAVAGVVIVAVPCVLLTLGSAWEVSGDRVEAAAACDNILSASEVGPPQIVDEPAPPKKGSGRVKKKKVRLGDVTPEAVSTTEAAPSR